jgi:AraC-like DNA-binding protein
MLADPFHRWTVKSLAQIATMSRSIFAERFTAAVGEPPLRYLSRWRLTIAADLLRSGGLKVTEAAYRSGYASDAAFSRAFKAHFGYAPSEVRHQPPV